MHGKPEEILLQEEKLIDLKLDIPFSLKFTKALQKQGIEIEACTTMERLVDEVCRLHFDK